MKAHSKAQGVLSLVPLLEISGPCAMLNDPAVYSLLTCTSGYHYIALSSEVQKKSAFLTLISKFELKKVLFGLAQA